MDTSTEGGSPLADVDEMVATGGGAAAIEADEGAGEEADEAHGGTKSTAKGFSLQHRQGEVRAAVQEAALAPAADGAAAPIANMEDPFYTDPEFMNQIKQITSDYFGRPIEGTYLIEPFNGGGHMSDHYKGLGYRVLTSDLFVGPEDQRRDAFKITGDEMRASGVIGLGSNPPYGPKLEVIDWALRTGIKFMLIMPTSMSWTRSGFEALKNKGISMLTPARPPQFFVNGVKKTVIETSLFFGNYRVVDGQESAQGRRFTIKYFGRRDTLLGFISHTFLLPKYGAISEGDADQEDDA